MWVFWFLATMAIGRSGDEPWGFQFPLLLQARDAGVKADQRIEDRENVAAVLHHTFEHFPQTRFALSFSVPASQYLGGDFDIPAKFFGRMTSQKKSIKEGCFALRVFKFPKGLLTDDELLGHTRKRSLPKVSVSSRGLK